MTANCPTLVICQSRLWRDFKEDRCGAELSVMVADDTGVQFLDRPGRREAADCHALGVLALRITFPAACMLLGRYDEPARLRPVCRTSD
jgi:hypothetical protein